MPAGASTASAVCASVAESSPMSAIVFSAAAAWVALASAASALLRRPLAASSRMSQSRTR
jgi:hypothetical protein